MRGDNVGIFWEDLPSTKESRHFQRPMPAIPETGWLPPREFPNLRTARSIAIDLETYDPELKKFGPGWARGKGHIVGAAVGTPDGGRWYFPMRHEVEPEYNMNPDAVLRWLADMLGDKRQAKIGANIIYDVGWLRQEGVNVAGRLVDVQYAEALLHESGLVALDTLGRKYLKQGKTSNALYEWCAAYYGGSANSDQRANIYRTPPRLAGPYAEGDVDLPLRVIVEQYPLLEREGLLPVFDMECELIPLLIDMRFAGVRVAVDRAESVAAELRKEAKALSGRLRTLAGVDVNVNAADSIAAAFKKLGLHYNYTAAKNPRPSFTKAFLSSVNHPAAKLILDIRRIEKTCGTFVEGYILDANVNGMVYGQFHPLRSDSGGTRSGRLSSSTPNLQNIPSRDDVLAPLVRGLFVPDEGHLRWLKGDYSQIEYRGLAHYAIGQGSDEVREIYRTAPETDYHAMTQQLVLGKTGKELARKPIKNINFGLIYGMGTRTLAGILGLSKNEAEELFAAYHEGAPFIRATMEATQLEASTTGIITTIMGRRSRFDLWEPQQWDETTVPLPYDAAMRAYGLVRRAYTHKALNRRLQGSAADLMKFSMLQCYKDGVFAETGVPRLTVHDELDFSDPGNREQAFTEMKRVLETALPLRVPVKLDMETGPDWGHVE